MSEENKVGYCKPPKHTQFKPGQSGNPRGRPKGSKNFKTDVKDALEEPVRLTESGRRKTVSTQTAALRRLREKALRGDARALDRLLALAEAYNDEEVTEKAAQLSLTDSEVMEAFKTRLLRRAGSALSEDSHHAQSEEPQELNATNDGEDLLKEEDEDAWLR